jgi:hypothetical protein
MNANNSGGVSEREYLRGIGFLGIGFSLQVALPVLPDALLLPTTVSGPRPRRGRRRNSSRISNHFRTPRPPILIVKNCRTMRKVSLVV